MTAPKINKVSIFSSSDFESFKFFNFNRPVNKSHVKTLVESMERWGFQSTLTVIKTSVLDDTEQFYVLDGQHRFSAAKVLGIPFEFKTVDIETKLELAQFIADVNNSAKAWGTNQFLNVWARMEIKEYVKMHQVQTETKMQITPLVRAYTGKSSMNEFRKGDMKFIDEANSDKIISQIMELNDYLPKKAFCRRAIIDIMNSEDYNHELVKPKIISRALVSGFSENETDLRNELKVLVKASIFSKVS
jgi:hypothetical protein